MINFKDFNLTDKPIYDGYKKKSSKRGCEMSFGNLFLWGRQQMAEVHGHLAFFATFSKSFYPFPFGDGDKRAVIDALMLDSKERGIDFVLTSLSESDKQTLESLYPERFEFTTDIGSYDYVYDIEDLATLAGKKYHKKRNHLNNFIKANPDYRVEPISKKNINDATTMVIGWYNQKGEDHSLSYEKAVFGRAMDNFDGLGLEGLVLYSGEQVIAVTFASLYEEDTFDVHFEKAVPTIDGAYTAINYEFARYIKAKYPQVKFLNREEDMGIEGLRRAKESYYPHHQIVKYKAKLK
jgi:hypothetical protein